MPILGPAEIAMAPAACLLLFGANTPSGLARAMGDDAISGTRWLERLASDVERRP